MKDTDADVPILSKPARLHSTEGYLWRGVHRNASRTKKAAPNYGTELGSREIMGAE